MIQVICLYMCILRTCIKTKLSDPLHKCSKVHNTLCYWYVWYVFSHTENTEYGLENMDSFLLWNSGSANPHPPPQIRARQDDWCRKKHGDSVIKLRLKRCHPHTESGVCFAKCSWHLFFFLCCFLALIGSRSMGHICDDQSKLVQCTFESEISRKRTDMWLCW